MSLSCVSGHIISKTFPRISVNNAAAIDEELSKPRVAVSLRWCVGGIGRAINARVALVSGTVWIAVEITRGITCAINRGVCLSRCSPLPLLEVNPYLAALTVWHPLLRRPPASNKLRRWLVEKALHGGIR